MNKDAQSRFRRVAEAMEADSEEFRRKAIASPSNLSIWTKLYAANQTILAAMWEHKVAPALVEICSNLLGCEELAIIEIERGTGGVHFLAAEGLPPERRDALIRNARALESRIEPGNLEIASVEDEEESAGLEPLGISALVPLWADERSRGAMLLFRLLPQRNGLDSEDREVLQLLSNSAGACLRNQRRG